jgi:hypothetical protein
MSELTKWRTEIPLRTFMGHLLDVRLPVWAWWVLAALIVLPISLGVSVRL